MKKVKWIIFGMLVALLAGCSGKKTAETSADAKNAESTDEKNTLDFVDAHGVIIPGLFEPPVRTLRATIPENESHIFR